MQDKVCSAQFSRTATFYKEYVTFPGSLSFDLVFFSVGCQVEGELIVTKVVLKFLILNLNNCSIFYQAETFLNNFDFAYYRI